MIKAGDKVRRIGGSYDEVYTGGTYKVAEILGESEILKNGILRLEGFGNTWCNINLFEKVGDFIYKLEQKHPSGGWIFLNEFDSKEEAIKGLEEFDSKNIRIVKVVAEYKTELKVY